MVHGSPGQRQVAEGDDRRQAWRRARDVLAAIAPEVEAAGITYCIEPLATPTAGRARRVRLGSVRGSLDALASRPGPPPVTPPRSVDSSR
jgi:hypothetical protein